jgi:hypothetical protein
MSRYWVLPVLIDLILGVGATFYHSVVADFRALSAGFSKPINLIRSMIIYKIWRVQTSRSLGTRCFEGIDRNLQLRDPLPWVDQASQEG